jgi:hypothetical protein
MTHRATVTALLGAVGLTLAACAVGGNPYPPVPPPLQPDVMTKPPVTTTPLIWQPAHWDWTGGGYTWVPGEYVARAGHSDNWMPGYWAQGPEGTWVWQPAHWL